MINGKLGFLLLSENGSRADYQLIRYQDEDIGVLYEIVDSFRNSSIPTLKKIEIRYPSLD
jgi:hypothetical protein